MKIEKTITSLKMKTKFNLLLKYCINLDEDIDLNTIGSTWDLLDRIMPDWTGEKGMDTAGSQTLCLWQSIEHQVDTFVNTVFADKSHFMGSKYSFPIKGIKKNPMSHIYEV